MGIDFHGGAVICVAKDLLEQLRLYSGFYCHGGVGVAAVIGCHVLDLQRFHEGLPVTVGEVLRGFVSGVAVYQLFGILRSGGFQQLPVGFQTDRTHGDDPVLSCFRF